MNKPTLVAVPILENKVSVMLMEGTRDMSETRISQIYPMKERPQVVKVYGEEECWFSFMLTSNNLDEKTVFDVLSTFLMHFQQMYPSMLEEKITKLGNDSSSRMYFSVCSGGVSGKTYQMIYILPVNKQQGM